MNKIKNMNKIKVSGFADKSFYALNYVISALVLLVTLYPLYYVFIASVSSPNLLLNGKIWLIPKGITFEGYIKIAGDNRVLFGYKNSILYAAVGTLISLVVTLPASYALSGKELKLRPIIMFMFVFTMFFTGGIVPTFLLISELGLYDTFMVMVLPGAFSIWNMIIARTYFAHQIPNEIKEAAIIDGCTHTQLFIRIVLPLSKAITAIIALFCIVGHWNSFFPALIYLKSWEKYPLQIFLRDILVQFSFVEDMQGEEQLNNLIEVIKYDVIVVSILPMMAIYPFIQKYFVQGIMIGSLKG